MFVYASIVLEFRPLLIIPAIFYMFDFVLIWDTLVILYSYYSQFSSWPHFRKQSKPESKSRSSSVKPKSKSLKNRKGAKITAPSTSAATLCQKESETDSSIAQSAWSSWIPPELLLQIFQLTLKRDACCLKMLMRWDQQGHILQLNIPEQNENNFYVRCWLFNEVQYWDSPVSISRMNVMLSEVF